MELALTSAVLILIAHAIWLQVKVREHDPDDALLWVVLVVFFAILGFIFSVITIVVGVLWFFNLLNVSV